MKLVYHSACLCLVLAGLPICAGAQTGVDDVLVTGIVERDGAPTHGLVVILSSRASFDRRADVEGGGEFRFFGVPSGEYELSVTTVEGAILHRQYVVLRSLGNHVSVRLPAAAAIPTRTGALTVSAARLSHNVPSNARKEFDKGMKAAKRGNSAEAIGHLARSIELDPGFVEAYNSLGAQHLEAKADQTALSYFQKAIELDSGAPEPHVNLALTLLKLERYAEAETVARVAVRLAGNDPVSHYYLGIALLKQTKNPAEALDALERASDRIPRARLAIATVSERAGDTERAKNELRRYLKQRAPEFRQVAEQWLARLEQPPTGEQLRTPDQGRWN